MPSGRPTRSPTASRPARTRPATSSARWPTRPTSAATRASSTTPPSTTGTRVANTRPPVRDQPVLRVQLHQRHQLQPGLAQPDEVREGGRRVRRRRLPLRGEGDDHGAGDPGRQRQLSDAEDRGEQPPLPAARPGLRQPGRAADEPRPGLRLGRGPQLRRRHHGADARRGLPPELASSPATTAARSSSTTSTASRSCGIIAKHRDAAYALPTDGVPQAMLDNVHQLYDEVLELGTKHGFRNAQVTVLAPTGTIAFMMDCDTTGIEPDIALIKYKKLVGEGYLKIVNQTVPAALRKLGYTPAQVEEIIAYVNERETIEGAPGLRHEHLPVFDCAFKPVNGERSIHYMGHIRMMGAVQPFLSGAISKTVNMPEAATAEEIETVYLEGWKQGLKAIAIYRDGSKRSQPPQHRQEEGRGLGRGQGHDREPAQAARGRPGRGHPPAPPPPPERADGRHPQVRDQRPRGLHHRRPLPGRPARRDLPQDGQGRLHDQRPDGHAGDLGQPGAPVRRAAAGRGEQVRPRAVRAQRLHRQPGDPDRQVASWTTSSAGWDPGSCRARRRAPSG